MRSGLFTKKRWMHFVPALVFAALAMQGCHWNDSEYEKYVKDGDVQKCEGYNLLALKSGRYIRKLAENEYICGTYNEVKLEKQPVKSEICKPDQNIENCCTEDEIELAKDAFKNSICTKYAYNCVSQIAEMGVVETDGSKMCSECEEGQVSCNGVCVQLNDDSDNCGKCGIKCDYAGKGETCINGICDPNCDLETKSICFIDDKPKCTDTQNDPKHCGDCNIDCSRKEDGKTRCKSGECVSPINVTGCAGEDILTCYKYMNNESEYIYITLDDLSDPNRKYDADKIVDMDNPECISPTNENTCGAKGCNPEDYVRCGDSYVCVKENTGTFTCKCPAGTVEVDESGMKRCANPKEPEHCGIGISTEKGTDCTKLTDSDKRECNGYQCVCAPNFVECNGQCIDPLSDNAYCGADDQCQNYKQCRKEGTQNQQCTNGVCACTTENWVNCDGECIEPYDDIRYCGAKGLCTSDDVNSLNYHGLNCGTTEAKCSLTESKPKCVCDNKNEYYDEIQKECVFKTTPERCGDDLVDCRAIYHANAKCEEGACKCPNNYVRLDVEPYKSIYEAKKDAEGEGFVEPSILCVDNRLDHRFCGDNLVTCADDEMCLDGTCQAISKNLCEVKGRTLCENRCISFGENHMVTCDKCQDDWCSTELLVSTAGCNTKVGIGLNNCEKCLYSGNEQVGSKCLDRYQMCNNNKCSCGFNESEINVKNESGVKFKSCVNMSDMKIEDCIECTYDFKCRNGWGDCVDGDRNLPSGVIDGVLGVDGCETNIHEGQLNNDGTIENCGACGSTCNPAHVDQAKCSDGVCSYNKCDEGYGNCSGNLAEGCTTPLNTVEHCGVCGKVCSEGGCNEGKCCWNNTIYTTSTLTQDDCCPGTRLYQACNNNPFHRTRYTCAADTPSVDTDGWCSWSLVE